MTSQRVERSDDRRGHFVVMLVDACNAARLGRLRVDVTTGDGSRLHGVPDVRLRAGAPAGVEDPAGAVDVSIDGEPVDLDLVVAFTVRLGD